MAKAEFWARHTFAFAGGFLALFVLSFWMRRGMPVPGLEDLAIAAAAALLALFQGALYSLGCAWGGVARPRRVSWAVFCGVATAAGFLFYMALGSAFAPAADLEEAKQEYTRGLLAVLYVFAPPAATGLLCALFSRRPV